MQAEVKWLMDYLDSHEILPEMQQAINLAFKWAHTTYSYASKNQRIQEWRRAMTPSDTPFYAIMCHVFSGALLHPQGMTYQAMIGYISSNVQCADPLDRAKCAAEIIALAYQADLIVITRTSDRTLMVTTEFELPVEIPEFGKHLPQFKRPSMVDYTPILGCRFKQHTEDICTEHIDKMNAIPLTLETRVIDTMEEYQKAQTQTDEQEEQWQDFKRRSAQAYQQVIDKGNRFFMHHDYDTRGRCYCAGYYINYQGSQYKKAIVQLADKEVVKI